MKMIRRQFVVFGTLICMKHLLTSDKTILEEVYDEQYLGGGGG